jgi:hypothetical protein
LANQYKIKCLNCGKNGSFSDAKDVTQSKWRIMAWDVGSADPKAVCEKCEYHPSGEPPPKKKKV